MRRYPLANLADALGLPLEGLGARLSVSGSTWKEYRDLGVSERVGDRLAVKVGLTPYEVWPEMLDDAIADASIECPECRARFIPPTKRRVYCSKPCANRADNRRRHTDPVRHQAELERQRRRYQETRTYELGQRRRHYLANREAIRTRQNAYKRQLRREAAA